MMMVDAEIKLPNNLPYSLLALAVLVKGAIKRCHRRSAAQPAVPQPTFFYFFTI